MNIDKTLIKRDTWFPKEYCVLEIRNALGKPCDAICGAYCYRGACLINVTQKNKVFACYFVIMSAC